MTTTATTLNAHAPRLSLPRVAPDMYAAMSALEEASKPGIDPGIRELVKIRASQVNQCAFCIDMHTKDARAAGETEQRIYALSAWRETPFFTEPERAALGLAEALTDLHTHDRIDAAWEEAAEYFADTELAALLTTIVTINAWNRIAIASRTKVGGYQPRAKG